MAKPALLATSKFTILPAVVNAVIDALSFKGVKHIDMPITSEKVWKILNDQSY